jgi:hypothetical protein
MTRYFSQIDSWVGPKNNKKNQEDQVIINQIWNEKKNIKYKKNKIKRIRTSFEEKKKQRGQPKNLNSREKLKKKINK